MGRVDEAMRRAAEGSASSAPAQAEVASFANELFPTEEAGADDGERTLSPPVPESDVLGDVSIQHAFAPEVSSTGSIAAPDDAVDAQASSIFERLDPRLAGKIVVDLGMKPTSREQYRHLAATLHQAQVEHGLKVIIVVSAVAAEGKTLTAVNLGLTLSESYHRQVLLVDGDLRRPSLHSVLNVTAAGGLSDGLSAEAEPKLPLHQVSPRLTLLPGGRPMSDPMAGLTSDRMRRIIAEARAAFDWVIVDTPPVGLLPDGHLLASMGDGALLVVKAGGPSHGLIQRAIESVGRDRVIGVVLNKAEEPSGAGSYYRYEYRGQSSPAAS